MDQHLHVGQRRVVAVVLAAAQRHVGVGGAAVGAEQQDVQGRLSGRVRLGLVRLGVAAAALALVDVAVQVLVIEVSGAGRAEYQHREGRRGPSQRPVPPPAGAPPPGAAVAAAVAARAALPTLPARARAVLLAAAASGSPAAGVPDRVGSRSLPAHTALRHASPTLGPANVLPHAACSHSWTYEAARWLYDARRFVRG
ncbi:hypothetical protein RKD37_005511 [Streptomyces ambofaciens]